VSSGRLGTRRPFGRRTSGSSNEELGFEGERLPFLCECDNERCTDLILVLRDEYRFGLANPRRFLVAEGHDPDARVVSSQEGFEIVEKEGREGELVEEFDS
jgi:hypothetical protein